MFRFGLKNLRRLENIPPVKLGPVTVLVGRNSSGKSSFLRSLPLLRQSITTRTSSPILWYGDWVDFGDFEGAVLDNDVNLQTSFLFGLDDIIPEPEYYADEGGFYATNHKKASIALNVEIKIGKNQNGTRITSIHLHEPENKANYVLDVDENNRVHCIKIDGTDLTSEVKDAEISVTSGSILPFLIVRLPRERKSSDNVIRTTVIPLEYVVRLRIIEMLSSRLDKRIKKMTLGTLVRNLLSLNRISKDEIRKIGEESANRSWQKLLTEIGTSDRLQLYPRLREMILLARTQTHLGAFSQRAKRIVSSTLYIGPARAKSDRYYRYQDLAVSEIDPDGKNFPMFLNSLAAYQIENFSQWVKQYFKYGVSVARESGHISIKLEYDSNTVNIVDTGYGVSQILPVLGQVWWATNRDRFIRSREAPVAPIIVIEQPELHLHPAHQAMLADAFVSSLSAGLQSGRDAVRPLFIIETHSEALINRLGMLIAERQIASESVQILVFEPDPDNDKRTSVRVVPFDEEGQLIDWPYGFFSPAT